MQGVERRIRKLVAKRKEERSATEQVAKPQSAAEQAETVAERPILSCSRIAEVSGRLANHAANVQHPAAKSLWPCSSDG